jgi:uncharacterized protein YjiS (DUF1127 family)
MSAVTDWNAPAMGQVASDRPSLAIRALEWARRRIEIHRNQRVLEGFSDRALSDIGIGRSSIAWAVENGVDRVAPRRARH